MKHTRIIVLTAFVTLCSFIAFIQSSCKKDKCKGVACHNTGLCTDGKCTCPSGYFGKFCDSTSMSFTNTAPTPLTIAVNGTSTIVQPDSAITFKGTAGSGLFISAYTAVTNAAGKLRGKAIAWSFGRYFPTNGDQYSEALTISAGSFFLQMKNQNFHDSVVLIYVNYQNPHDQTYDTVNIPHDSKIYNIGYYDVNPSTRIYANGGIAGDNWSWTPAIKDTVNSSVIVTVY